MREISKFTIEELSDLDGKILEPEELEELRNLDGVYDFLFNERSVVYPKCNWYHIKLEKTDRDGTRNLHLEVYVEKNKDVLKGE